MADVQETISSRQHRAIASILSARTMGEAAIQAGIGERTLYRWLLEPGFRQELKEAENNLITDTARRLVSGQGKALDTLEELIDHATKESERRLAAQAWMEFVIRWHELSDIDTRLTKLETVVHNYQGRE